MQRTFLAVTLAVCALPAFAQQGRGGRGGQPAGPPPTPKAQAPIDMTGTWVSLITEDWVYRMTIPPKDAKGRANADSVPLTPAARTAADSWDPAKDEAAGTTCKAYGAAGLMRLPTRLQIDWADDNTLRVQTDAGTQTRLFHFTGDAAGPASLQGYSKASWDGIGGRGRGQGNGFPATFDPNAPAATVIRPGAMKVITTNLSGGYLRRNGLPYGDRTTVTEFYDVVHEPDGTQYLIVSTTVEDPVNLTGPFRTSTHFKKEANNAKFKPQPCSVR